MIKDALWRTISMCIVRCMTLVALFCLWITTVGTRVVHISGVIAIVFFSGNVFLETVFQLIILLEVLP